MWVLAFIPALWLGWMGAKVLQVLGGLVVVYGGLPAVWGGVDVGFYLVLAGGGIGFIGTWMTAYEMSLLRKQRYWVDNGLVLLGYGMVALGSAVQPATWLGWAGPVLATVLVTPMLAIWVGRILMLHDAILVTASKFVAMMFLLAALQVFVWWLLP